MDQPHPHLHRVKLEQLRPTQLTVGMREVRAKRVQWKKMSAKARKALLQSHWFPGVLGPDQAHYVVDHHHLGLALIKNEVRDVPVLILKDLSFLEPHAFWRVMEHHQWVHPYDAQGQRHECAAIPGHLNALQDDPYRSLAGELRMAGGYAKDTTPFSEFLWADFLRPRIPIALIQDDFATALKRSSKLAHTPQARYLPGWSGAIAAQA